MWIYNGEEFTLEKYPDCYGFIYEIENIIDGRKYIGRKFCTKAGYKTVKGKRKKIRLESDWKDYYGSSKSLQEDIDLLGHDKFCRTILRVCKSRSECNYYEGKYILAVDAVLDMQYYNQWCSFRVQAPHVKSLIFNSKENLCVDKDT